MEGPRPDKFYRCFRIVKTQKISRGCAAHVMGIAVCSERSSCPCLCSGVDEKSVSRSVGSWNFQGAFPVKKNTAHAAQRWFCRVNRRQNESGVLRGGKFFRGLFLTEVVGLTVITNHFLWLCSKWTRPHLVDEFEPIHKINGIYKKNTTACRMRQEGFEKFIEVKQEKYDTSCGFRKKYAMWIRTNPIFCLR